MTPISQAEPRVELALPQVPVEDRLTGLLHPAGYRLLVQILPPEDAPDSIGRTVHMPDDVRDREWGAMMWALVLECGPDAYLDDKKFPRGFWCQPGDTILMRPYSGTRFMLRGHLYALINDDTVQGVVRSET